jgi:hypothetical protein
VVQTRRGRVMSETAAGEGRKPEAVTVAVRVR